MNFAAQDLRGRTFRNQDLSGMDFSRSDIRGVNFKNAILRGANFTAVKAGVRPLWRIGQLVAAVVLAIVLSAVSTLPNAVCVVLFWQPAFLGNYGLVPGSVLVLAIVTSLWAIVSQGFTVKGVLLYITAIAMAGLVTAAVAGTLALGVAGAVAMTGVGLLFAAITVVIGSTAFSSVVILVSGITAGLVAGSVVAVGSITVIIAIVVTISITMATMVLSSYIAWRILAGDDRFAPMRVLGIALLSVGGTNFQGADLSEANFTGAVLPSTNFSPDRTRPTVLTRVRWRNAQKLEQAVIEQSILVDPRVCQLLVTGQGNGQDYQQANLRGANLAGAQLNNANLKRADLSQATLGEADLQYANLTEAQAIAADLRGAYLTGACLQAWNIDHTTALEDIECQFIYLLEEPDSQGDRERRPHDPDRIFQAGDFEQLYQQLIHVVQILLKNGMNPDAFRSALQTLMQANSAINYGSIQGIERRGPHILLTLEVPETTNKAQVEQTFLDTYETHIRQLAADAQGGEVLTAESSDSVPVPTEDLSQIVFNYLLTEPSLSKPKSPPAFPAPEDGRI